MCVWSFSISPNYAYVLEEFKLKSFGAYSPQGRIAYLKGPQIAETILNHLCRELSNHPQEELEGLNIEAAGLQARIAGNVAEILEA